MAKFLLLVFLLATYTIPIIAHGSSPSQSPSPTQSPTACSDVVNEMADCLSYIEIGSQEKKPKSTCCDGLKVVVNKSPDCLCEGIKLAPTFGIKLDMKRATRLPHACGLPDFGGCNETTSPPSPVVPPSSPPLSPPPSVSTPPPVSKVPPVSPPQHSPAPPVSTPPPVSKVPPVSPPHHSPAPPVSTPPPVSQVPPVSPPQDSPAPPVSPPKPPLVDPPTQISQPPALAPSSSGTWKTTCSMLTLCVGVAIASFSFLHA